MNGASALGGAACSTGRARNSTCANLVRALVALAGLLIAGLFLWITEGVACREEAPFGFDLPAQFGESTMEAIQVFVVFSVAATAGKSGNASDFRSMP
eukprot:CAMPEP_0206594140 /NCGR_PEP_ID=MMETSP0325_2-20121206/42165_1 /ASSEMBLY_ACC=CAM_ASM_000347 /TAXON_ID=2866 /ORGANISM="Crypthecodinium cohnii, Strain Seligo" /LENGTH=97 /DNA_ID=CAMNT_0054104481 /DNA_START=128 /DNA_END=419 /DNA_ORIENTATION=+